MKKYKVSIVVGVVEGESLEQATKNAINHLENFIGSNDGSELLANATPILEETQPNAKFSKWHGFQLTN